MAAKAQTMAGRHQPFLRAHGVLDPTAEHLEAAAAIALTLQDELATQIDHFHLHVIEPGRCTYFLDDVRFADDPRMAGRSESIAPRGGSGLTRPELGADGIWQVHRDIHLGANVPGYDRCAAG